MQTISQQFVNDKVDLICAIATPAAQSVASATSDIPIVATAVTDFADAKLVASNEKPETNVTGTTDMNPIGDQIDLLLQIAPDAKKIGVMYSSSEDNSVLQVKIMKEYALSKGLEVIEGTVSSVNDIQQVAQNVIDKGAQAMYVPTDNVMASSVPTLLQITDPAKIPVICGEASVVEAGCLATIGIDYYKLGLQTGEMAARILNGEAEPASMAIESLKDMTITLNETGAKNIGITFPAELTEKATIIK